MDRLSEQVRAALVTAADVGLSASDQIDREWFAGAEPSQAARSS